MIKATTYADTGWLTKNDQSILDVLDAPNIPMDETALNGIATRVCEEYEIDLASRADWMAGNAAAMKIARQVVEEKTFPWSGAANVRYPLVAQAAQQFSSYAYPGIVDGRDVVKGAVTGPDPKGEKKARAIRIGDHMSYQLLVQIREWEDETDRLLAALPITGLAFRKVWYDPDLGRARCEYVPADRLVVSDHAKNLDEAVRVTYVYDLSPRDIYELMVAEVWNDLDLPQNDNDPDAPHTFLEQHRYLDLDGDGYAEPYVVTVHQESQQTVRVAPRFSEAGVKTRKTADEGIEVLRITPEQYFVKYEFMPDPEARFHGMGYGRLLGPINETINTSINQMLDAGTLQNMGGGFIGRGVVMRSGAFEFAPGEWKKIDAPGDDLRKNIVPLDHAGPSQTTFALLGLLIEAAKDLGGLKPALTGEGAQQNQPVGTTMALIEQGLKGFTAIYKRVHRSLADEYRLLARLNKLYLEPEAYYEATDQQKSLPREDYDDSDIDVRPVSDPKVVTDMQRFGKSQLLMQFLPDPMFEPIELRRRILEGGGVENVEGLLNVNFTKQQQEQAAKQQQLQTQLAIAEEQRKAVELKLKIAETEAKVEEMRAQATYHIARAEAEEAGQQVDAYRAHLEATKVRIDDGGGVPGMAEPPSDQGIQGLPQDPGQPPGPELGGGLDTL